MTDNPLGKLSDYPKHYTPQLLFAIPRKSARENLSHIDNEHSLGIDHWHAYELSWLNSKGKPQVAIADFFFAASSPNIIESKSLKLYLNSLNHSSFANAAVLKNTIADDLSVVSGDKVTVVIHSMEDKNVASIHHPQGLCLDTIDIEINEYTPNSQLLKLASVAEPDEGAASDLITENYYSNLFRSNCPVTDQPDWATVTIEYTGQQIDPQGLLAYLCSYRNHQGFHEACAENIFCDIRQRCVPRALTVAMNFLRRGGLDINCYRSTSPLQVEAITQRRLRQ